MSENEVFFGEGGMRNEMMVGKNFFFYSFFFYEFGRLELNIKGFFSLKKFLFRLSKTNH